ncbi:MAG: ribbon-helix-helix domain-containing protein [Methanocellales archaeon]|nr:ribbon-helix-helix domain-containing protein [Methanocellales archaeon]MDI6902386.1 ribbon-helix-helix domain-containing protein [Methanocellales archaeon]
MSSETIPARFSKKDVKLLDYFVEEGYFSTKSDLIRESVRHYIHELSLREIRMRVPQKEWTEGEIQEELGEIKRIRRKLWKV